jgi:hypothetical protein
MPWLTYIYNKAIGGDLHGWHTHDIFMHYYFYSYFGCVMLQEVMVCLTIYVMHYSAILY